MTDSVNVAVRWAGIVAGVGSREGNVAGRAWLHFECAGAPSGNGTESDPFPPLYQIRSNMDQPDVDTLGVQVREHFREHASSYALDAASLRIDYVLNWGGFVNASFVVRDAVHRYHLKLATTPDGLAALTQWRELAPLLAPYHAPRVVDWVDLGDAAGLLFEYVAGAPPALGDDLLAELLPVLGALGADAALAERVKGDREHNAADEYRGSFHQRFVEDLSSIREARPPFLLPAQLDRLEAEAAYLADLVGASPAFAEPLSRPVHGDLWLNNILWAGSGAWHLLDWDDLRIGDPAIDLATLLGPTSADLAPLRMLDRVLQTTAADVCERLPLLGRATLLDWVIDPVADWVDAHQAPGVEGVVRLEKERVHREALTAYDLRYGLRR